MYAITSVNTFGSWNPKKWEFYVAVEEYFGEYSTGTVQYSWSQGSADWRTISTSLVLNSITSKVY
jgi:hypothetical protein